MTNTIFLIFSERSTGMHLLHGPELLKHVSVDECAEAELLPRATYNVILERDDMRRMRDKFEICTVRVSASVRIILRITVISAWEHHACLRKPSLDWHRSVLKPRAITFPCSVATQPCGMRIVDLAASWSAMRIKR